MTAVECITSDFKLVEKDGPDKSEEVGCRLNSSAALTKSFACSILNSRSLDLDCIIGGAGGKEVVIFWPNAFSSKTFPEDSTCALRLELNWNGIGTVDCRLPDFLTFSS